MKTQLNFSVKGLSVTIQTQRSDLQTEVLTPSTPPDETAAVHMHDGTLAH